MTTSSHASFSIDQTLSFAETEELLEKVLTTNESINLRFFATVESATDEWFYHEFIISILDIVEDLQDWDPLTAAEKYQVIDKWIAEYVIENCIYCEVDITDSGADVFYNSPIDRHFNVISQYSNEELYFLLPSYEGLFSYQEKVELITPLVIEDLFRYVLRYSYRALPIS